MFRIFVRNNSLARVGELDEYLSMRCWLRYNDVGAWELSLSAKDDLADELTNAASGPSAGIEIVKDGNPFFSGPITRRVIQRQASNKILQVFGVDDSYWLRNRIIYPEPGGSFGTQEFDVRTAAKETVIKQYVDYNLGPNALSLRRLANFTIEATQGRGSTVTGRARFENLLEFIRSLAIDSNPLNALRFDVEQVGAGLVFKAFVTQDLSSKIVFSEDFGTIGDYNFSQVSPKDNHVWVGGSGTGIDRVFREQNDYASQTTYGRIESFLDHSNTNTFSELDAAGAAQLAQDGDEWGLDAAATPTENIVFGTDYNLGDMVSYSVGGTRFSELVREVEVAFDSQGDPTVKPKVGSPGTGYVIRMFEEIRKHRQQLRLLERR